MAVPFLLDLEVHVKFLVAMPLLIAAELVVHQRLRSVLKVFLERHLIPESAMTRFNAAMASAIRLRNSVLRRGAVDRLCVCRRHPDRLASLHDARHGHMVRDTDHGRLDAIPSRDVVWLRQRAGLPVFAVRWYFRMFIWTRFLWQVSRIELRLVPSHPDRVGGLGFLSITVYAFIPLLMAHGALLAGNLANRIFYLDAALTDFKLEIAVMVGLSPVRGPRPAPGVCAAVGAGETRRPARIRHAGGALRARVRCQMAARWRACR